MNSCFCSFISVDLACLSSHYRYTGDLGLKKFYEFYDIGCQWSRGFHRRLEDNLQLFNSLYPGAVTGWPRMHVGVGAFHMPNHTLLCRMLFNIRFIPGAARSYGDQAEGIWAQENRIGPSVAEMGSGSREDSIELHFDNQNSQRRVEIGAQYLCAIKVTFTNSAFSSYTSCSPPKCHQAAWSHCDCSTRA